MTSSGPFVTRAGEKLDAALRAFGVSPLDQVCCDLGSHVGGFVDCLLRHGARRVYAVDPGYGLLAPSLRSDPRVNACERTNAIDFLAPEPCELVTIDVGWTPLRLVLPSVRRTLAAGGSVIALVKPQYEAGARQRRAGVVAPAECDAVFAQVRADLHELGWRILGEIDSPIAGHGGNLEALWHCAPRPAEPARPGTLVP